MPPFSRASPRGDFSMEAIKKAIELILERIGLVLLIAGIGLVVVGGSGNVPYVPIHQREAQIALAVFGVVLAAVGIWLEIRGSGVKPLGIEILTPINGAHLEEQ